MLLLSLQPLGPPLLVALQLQELLLLQQLEEVQQQLQLPTSPCAPVRAILQTCTTHDNIALNT